VDNRSAQRVAAHISPTTPKRLLPLPAVLERTGVCRSLVYAMMSRGHFPRPVKVGRASRWLEAEVDHWIQAAADARDTAKAA
jgi:prophage regulatory protein